jgi:hypothetical protein
LTAYNAKAIPRPPVAGKANRTDVDALSTQIWSPQLPAIEPTPLLVEHRRLLSTLAAIEAQEHDDDAVNAVSEELSEVGRKILSQPLPMGGDMREKQLAVLERLEVAEWANIGCEEPLIDDDRSVVELISAVRMLLKDDSEATAML